MIELSTVTKGWHLGIEDIHAEYYAEGDRWLRFTDEIRDDDRWEEEIFHTCCTLDILMNYLQYVPGHAEYSDYGDLYIEFNIGDVKEAGWTEAQLRKCLQFLADHVNCGGEIIAECEPYPWESTDIYGSKRTYFRFGALIPPKGMKTLKIEHPVGLTT